MDNPEEMQSLVYARDLRRVYEDALAKQQALEQAQEQLVRYAADLKAAYEAEVEKSLQLKHAYFATVKTLAAAVEARDPYTGGHVERVTLYCIAIARELGWEAAQLEEVEMGGALHDIGKVGVDDAVLRKPTRLDPQDWEMMRRHPETGARILAGAPFLGFALPYVLYHHEHMDGSGYPAGLVGEDIPMTGRVTAVADAFDALTSDRPYRKGRPVEEALQEITRWSGVQFDEQAALALMRAVESGRLEV